VLLNVFVGNDIHDNLTEDRVKVVDGYLVDDGDGPSSGVPLSDVHIALSRSHLYQLLWPLQRRLRDSRFADQERQHLQAYLAIYNKQPDAHVEAMWAATLTEIARVRALTRSLGIALAVVVIPELRQVDSTAWTSMTAENAAVYGRDIPNRRIVEYCTKEGIPVLDLLPAFLDAGHPRKNYFRVDNHWTVEGNIFAGRAIGRFLTERHLVAGVTAPVGKIGSGG
jgi:hypothetical protein